MFPFRGMPEWAQWLGSVLPLTYLQPARARHPAQGQRLARPVAEPLADDRVRVRRDADRGEVLPEDARLRCACAPSSLACCSRGLHGRSGLSRARSACGRSLCRRGPCAARHDPVVRARHPRGVVDGLRVAATRRARAARARGQPDARRGARAPRRRRRNCARHAQGATQYPQCRLDGRCRAAAHRPGHVRLSRGAQSRARSTSSRSGLTASYDFDIFGGHAPRARGAGSRDRLPGLRARRRAPDACEQRGGNGHPAGGARRPDRARSRRSLRRSGRSSRSPKSAIELGRRRARSPSSNQGALVAQTEADAAAVARAVRAGVPSASRC